MGSGLILPRDQAEQLLGKLCVQLGLCIPPDEWLRLATEPPSEAIAFTDAVFLAEGLDPATADRHLYRQARDIVIEAFRRASNV